MGHGRVCAVWKLRAATAATLGLIGFGAAASAAAQDAKETPAEVIAAQIRTQGYSCAGTLGAERDLERSKPHEAVWILKCKDGTYRVRLIPDMAARVERLD